jgi:cytochrome b subunit of formate dehydrogenase
MGGAANRGSAMASGTANRGATTISGATSRRVGGWVGSAGLCCLLLTAPLARAAISNEECLACHSDTSMVRENPDSTKTALWVDATVHGNSVHMGLACTDCHADISEVPHGGTLAPVSCGNCHGDAQAIYDTSTHGKAVAAGHAHAPRCYDCHGKHDIRSASDPESPTSQFKLVETCARCHADPKVTQALPFGNRAPVAGYMKSVHGKALLVDKDPGAPNCGTCHPAHEVLPPGDPTSLINRMNLPKTCSQCHGDIYAVYSESVHGVAVARGLSGAPTCSDCHGEHQIEGPDSPTSTVFPANISKTTCPACHGSIMAGRRNGLDPERIASFGQTYHGLASRRGDLQVANCASCHGIHNIFPSKDPRSTVNKANLVHTCGECHPDANTRFASINVHPSTGDLRLVSKIQRPPADVVKIVYVVLLVAIIGGMAAHNGLIWWYHVVEKYRREKKSKKVRRFTKLEAVEHQLNLIAFFVLVLTGFALKFPDAGWVRVTESFGLSEELRGLTHRVMAVLMIGVALVHSCYLLFTKRGRKDLVALMPRISDVHDFLHNMAYHLRLRKDRPYFPRFDYTEKAEYLALLWGTSVMVLTGLILWFPTIASKHLPGWAFPVAEVIHYFEAWLAFLAILVWHFFYIFIHPENHPINLTFLDGKTTVEHSLHHHGKVEDDETEA